MFIAIITITCIRSVLTLKQSGGGGGWGARALPYVHHKGNNPEANKEKPRNHEIIQKDKKNSKLRNRKK